MQTNVGTIDRLLRVAVGLALVLWVLALNGPAWAWIGLLPLLTGAVGNCAVYTLLGINTCAKK